MKGQEIWDVDGLEESFNPQQLIVDLNEGDLPRRARYECVWCDKPTENSGTCDECAATPLQERK